MDKSTVINVNESVTQTTGRSVEQLIVRAILLYLLFGEKAIGMI